MRKFSSKITVLVSYSVHVGFKVYA